MDEILIFLSKVELEYPALLLLILPFLVCASLCKEKSEALIFPNIQIFKKTSQKKSAILNFFKYSTVLFLIVALASPVIRERVERSIHYGVDIVLALDTSGSMKEAGFDISSNRLNRLQSLKILSRDFIDSRKEDNLAIVVFADYSFVATPLTYDKKMVLDVLNKIDFDMAGERTAIFDALAHSISLLEDSNASEKIIILLTDGVNNSGYLPQDIALKMLKDSDAKAYTIGIGEHYEFDARVLRSIATSSGGKFYHARNAEILRAIYEEINLLQKSEIEGEIYYRVERFFEYPLFLSIIFALFYLLLRFRRGF